MKCIVCNKEAEYLYLGSSYCETHKAEHQVRINAMLKDQKPPNK